MIAVDSNLLVYAHRSESPWYDRASAVIRDLAEGQSPWAIAWTSIHEFYAVVTNAGRFRPPSSPVSALAQVEYWRESPSLVLLGETDSHWRELRKLIETGRIAGPRVHDARIAAICLAHGVRELWTADRDFGRFPSLATRNPLVEED